MASKSAQRQSNKSNKDHIKRLTLPAEKQYAQTVSATTAVFAPYVAGPNNKLIINGDALAHLVPFVTSDQIFDSRGGFHPQGLMSETIFGPNNTYKRRTSIALIDLHCRVIHPEVYRILKRLYPAILDVIHQRDEFIFDPKIRPDNPLIPASSPIIKQHYDELKESNPNIKPPKGRSGMIFLLEIWDDLKQIPNIDPVKNKRRYELWTAIKSLSPTQLFIRYLIVIPPVYRPITTKPFTHIDEINELYSALIKSSQSLNLPSVSSKTPTKESEIPTPQPAISEDLFNSIVSKTQTILNELFELIKLKFSKKQGLIRHDLLGKRVDFTARGVIIPGPDLQPNEVGLPLKIAVKVLQPFILHYLLFEYPHEHPDNEEQLKKILEQASQSKQETYSLSVNGLTRLLDDIARGYIDKNNIAYQFLMKELKPVVYKYPVILKRDPALHRENLSAFHPVLIDGDAIRLYPPCTKMYNADHDGDSYYGKINIEIRNKLTSSKKRSIITDITKLHKLTLEEVLNNVTDSQSLQNNIQDTKTD